ncbi:MAG: hypothetical protein JHC61_03455 [Burkholderiaceae bacterium]|nr:hypothetical protein [Burkholderiaceae bacterium]
MATTHHPPTNNGFLGQSAPSIETPDVLLEVQELAHFLATAALKRKCDAEAFVGRKICKQEHNGTPCLAFSDEVTAPSGTPNWEISQEIASLAQRQVLFMKGLGQDRVQKAVPTTGQRQSSSEVFTALLKRCSHDIQNDGRVIYQLDNVNVFVDHGRQLLMEPAAVCHDEAILVALLLAKEKFKTFELTGDMDFQRRALEVMVRYELNIPLRNAAQEALKDQLIKARYAETTERKDYQAPVAATAAKPTSATGEQARRQNGMAGESDALPRNPGLRTEQQKVPCSETTRCVDAHAWWQTQAAIIASTAHSEKEKEEQLKALGLAPDKEKAWWFDSVGNPCSEPKDLAVASALREAAGMASTLVSPQEPRIIPVPSVQPPKRSAKLAR